MPKDERPKTTRTRAGPVWAVAPTSPPAARDTDLPSPPSSVPLPNPQPPAPPQHSPDRASTNSISAKKDSATASRPSPSKQKRRRMSKLEREDPGGALPGDVPNKYPGFNAKMQPTGICENPVCAAVNPKPIALSLGDDGRRRCYQCSSVWEKYHKDRHLVIPRSR